MSRALAGRRRAVMTTETGAGNTGMIKVHRSPVGSDMAIITGVRTLNMCRALAGRCRAVMTT